jgi:peroxiredoxin
VIVDQSEPAKAVQFEKYQTLAGMSAVPLNYLIDKDGNVAAAWYGFDTGYLKEKLAVLGIK